MGLSPEKLPKLPVPAAEELTVVVSPVSVDLEKLRRHDLPPIGEGPISLVNQREVVPTPVKAAVDTLTERIGTNPLEFVQQVAAGLASLPTTAVGGAIGGYKGGLMRTVEEIEMGLTGTRGRAELWRTVYEWADTLLNAQSAMELITQLKRLGVFEEETAPGEAVAVAARFMNAVTTLREQEAGGEKRLAVVEQAVLAIELKTMVLQAEAAGSLTVAPFVGAAVEIFGRLPVLLAKEIGPGMMEALAETLAVGAEIPGRTTAALIVGPFKGIADGIKEVTEEITPGAAAGMAAFALFPVGTSILIVTGSLIPTATVGEKLLTVGFSGVLGLMIAVPIGAAVAWLDRRRNSAYFDGKRLTENPNPEANGPKIIEGRVRRVDPEEDTK